MKKKSANRQAGRPREFKEEYIRQARIAFSEGFTDLKFCELIGVCRDSLVRWRRGYPEFGKAVQEGKDEWDSDDIEKSLKKRAKGYNYTEVTRRIVKEENPEINPKTGKEKIKYVITKKVSKHVPSETAAIAFWLKNRRRDRWKDIKAVEASGPDGGPIPIDIRPILKDLTIDELRILKDIAAKAATAGNT